ncbi:MAG: shikimate kinase [Alphaproteobacteria bacterium]|nr:shikimate kinase [Alphaproteobacteria bacterium]MDP6591360.1 shikimate kinase [Alphaproteobacteria bacterium]MDP6818349.1 shikimate kinase [Alphaproteobacteria bacterium]
MQVDAAMNAAIGNSSPDRSIVLVGLMGSGKSAIGRRLAARIGMDFVDADAEIEKAAGLSIGDIFEVHGEQAFRDGERRVIARLLAGPAHVLATGGGAFMDEETRAKIGARAFSVWLRADFDVLLRRVSRRDNRPLLKVDNKEEVLRRLIEERYPIYEEADIIVQSRDGPHEETVNEVIAALKRLTADADGAPARDQAK